MTDHPSDTGAAGEQRIPTEDELRAAYEEEMKRLRVEDVVVQTTVSLLNLGANKAGLVAGTEGERDLAQVRMAIEGARALLPLIESQLGESAGPLRDALSQLQIAYSQLVAEGGGAKPQDPGAGDGAGDQPPAGTEPEAQEAGGPAQRSGRLWVPGQ